MPSRRELDRLRRANDRLVQLARRELRAFVTMLPDDPVKASREVAEFFPLLVRSYGDAGVAVAAEWFEDVAPRGARLELGGVIPEDQARATAGWAASAITPEDRAAMLSRLAGAAQRYVLAPGRQTLRRSAAASGAAWARVPSGPKTCAFCLMLASRGAVYESKKTARYASDGDRYHDDCFCTPTPIFRGEDYPEGYDPEALYGIYKSARDEAGSHMDTPAILSALRQQQGIN